MFERTVSLWRRMVQGRKSAETGLEDDRRIWVRFPADAEVSLRPARADGTSRFAAQLRDVSLGGASLVVNRAFQSGDLLTLELPGPEGQPPTTVLACVVHVARQADDEWALGCRFAGELGDRELAAFGARRSRPSGPDDLRDWERFACDHRANYRVVADPDGEAHQADVLNVSARGIALLVDREVEAGTLLTVEVQGRDRPAAPALLACVVHVSPHDRGWALGCTFMHELSEAQLEALV